MGNSFVFLKGLFLGGGGWLMFSGEGNIIVVIGSLLLFVPPAGRASCWNPICNLRDH